MSAQAFGKYPVTRRIGRGGIAEVFEARDPVLDRKVAVKVIHAHLAAAPGFNKRFQQEAERLARLRHPGIVQIYDFGSSDEQPYMVMEYLEGGCLRDLLAKRQAEGRALSPEEAAELAVPLAEALDYAHRRGMVHGDIRPANILLTDAGEPVLSDFGVGRLVAESAQGGSLLGASPTYMSPQQASGAPADAASDIYALAVVLYEMVAGRPPFMGSSPISVMMQQTHDAPPPPREFVPGLPGPAEAALLRALAKDSSARYPDARSLVRAFAEGQDVGGAGLAAQDPEPAAPGTIAGGAGPVAPAAGAERLPEPAPKWLSHLAQAAEVTGALIGREAPALGGTGDRRGMLAAAFGAVGILLAALQFIVQVFDLVNRSLAPVVKVMPYVITLLLVGGAGLSLYVRQRTHSPDYRKRATATFAFTLLIGLAWGGWTAYDRLRPVNGFVIAVGEFEGVKATRQIDFARRIYEELKTELAGAGDDVSVQRTLAVYPNSETARAQGAERKASLVIWGWYDDGGVSPHVETLRLPSLQRQSIAVPLLLGRAQAAPSSSTSAAAPQLKLADVATFVRTPASLPDYDLFVKNGPQQIARVAEAVLGMVYYANGRPEQALALFDKALAQGSAGADGTISGQEVLHFQRSTVLYQQGRLAEAQADLERAVELKPDLFEAHHNLAIVYAESCAPARQMERALAEAETAVRLRPDRADAHRLLGDLYEQAGRHDEAVAQLENALRTAPDDALVLASLATAYRSAGNGGQAEQAARQALAARQTARTGQSTDPIQAHLDIGDAYMGAGKHAEALAEYQAVQQLAPNDARGYRGIGNAQYWLGQSDRAAEAYRRWLDLSPKDASAHLLLGMLLDEQGRGDEAVVQLEQAAQLAGCSAAEHLVLGGVYFERGDLAGAVTEYERATEIEPSDPDAHYMLGSLRLQQYSAPGSSDPALLPQATTSLSTAVGLRPTFPEAYFALGQAYAEQKMWAEAATAWEIAVRQQPDDAGNRVALADAYEKVGRLDDAATSYQAALSLKEDASVRAFLGMIYEKQGKDEQALAEYRQATAIDPRSILGLAGQAAILARSNRWGEAVEAYRAALNIEDDAYLRAALASTLASMGKIDEAVAEYERSLGVAPDNWTAQIGVAALYRLRRLPLKAEAAYRAALDANPQLPNAQLNLAALAYQRCSLSEAAQAASAAVALDPQSPIYRASLAGIQAAQGQTGAAEQLYAELKTRPASDAVAHLLVGDYLFGKRRPGADSPLLEQAAAEYRLVIETPGTQPFLVAVAQAGLGQVYYGQDRLAPAKAALEAAQAVLPMHAGAQATLGDIAARQGDHEAALTAYDRAESFVPAYGVALSPDGAVLLPAGLELRRALVESALGRGDDANAALDRALAAAEGVLKDLPQWTQAQLTMAAVHLARGEEAQADAALQAAVECDASLAGARELIVADLGKLQ